MRDRLRPIIEWSIVRWPWLLAALAVIVGLTVYLYHIGTTVGFLKWSGFEDKTLWNVLEIAVVPLVLGIGGYLFSQTERKADREIAERRARTEREIATDRAQESLLQTYLDHMTELLLEKGLRTSDEGSEARAVARARTLTVLRGLDETRKGLLLQFLFESHLVNKDKVIVDLSGAHLSRAHLSRAHLSRAHLSRAHLSGADLSWADLSGADLSGAHLGGANLGGANLGGADLIEAHLSGANLSGDLHGADLHWAHLSGAHLSGADLHGADLHGADLHGAYLSWANLGGADLSWANLGGADLSWAGLTKAKVTDEQLATAMSLHSSTMPDGTKHE